MKRLKTSYRELMNRFDWDDVCDVMGWNPWMLNEGLADANESVKITIKKALQIGFRKPEIRNRLD